MDTSTFHAGEQQLQQRTGMRDAGSKPIGNAVMRDHMPSSTASSSPSCRRCCWACRTSAASPGRRCCSGRPGFIASPDAQTLRVARAARRGRPGGAVAGRRRRVGLLGLEPHTRRRNRANGRVRALFDGGFELQVQQSFGNCPKYIQARGPTLASRAGRTGAAAGPALDAASLALLGRADTLFIASASAARPGPRAAEGVDVSHRGGRPGFVRVAPAREGLRLTLPDYLGNFFFNTLGNLLAWPRAGLLVPDFDDGDLLQLAGAGPHRARRPGARRLPRRAAPAASGRAGRLVARAALPLRWAPAG